MGSIRLTRENAFNVAPRYSISQHFFRGAPVTILNNKGGKNSAVLVSCNSVWNGARRGSWPL